MREWKQGPAGCCVLLVGLMAATDVAAQDQGGERIEEIVVTAQRREQGLQQVPLAVSAMSAAQIRETGIGNSMALGDQVPSLDIKTFGGVPNIFIRGVGNNDFNSSSIGPVGIYRDDVALASTGSQIFALFDMQRIEVLRGPQGTLFGKNTTGGALQYFSALPDDVTEGYVRFGFGQYDRYEAETGISLPLSDTLAARFSGLIRRRDGQSTNLYTGDDAINIDEAAVRTILRWRPDEGTDVRLSIGTGRDRSDYLENKPLGTINGANLFGYSDPYPNDPRKLNFNGPSRNYADNDFITLNASRSFGDYSLKFISGYDQSDVDNRVDVDGSPQRIDEITFQTETWQTTQELQLAFDNGRLNWIAGLYFLYEDYDAYSAADLLGELTESGGALPVITDAARENTSYAAFGQSTIALGDRYRLTLGARYTVDEVKAEHQADLIPGYFDRDIPNGEPIPLVPYAQLDDSWDALSGRIALDADLFDDVLGYLSVTTGFKAGGFNIGIITSEAERTKVDPEYLTSYEAGIKSTLFDRRLRLNVGVFFYDYTDLQVLSVNEQGTGVPTLGLDNAADAKVQGLEFEAYAIPIDRLDVNFNFALLDAEYKNYTSGALDPETGEPRDFSGNQLPGSPEFSASLALQYEWLIGDYSLRNRAEYNYTGKKYYNNAQDELISSREGYGLTNLRAALMPASGEWEFALWAQNLTDETYIFDATDLRDFGFIPRYYGEGRTLGAEFTYFIGQ